MTVKTKLSEKDFTKASLTIIWSRPFSKIAVIIFLVILGFNMFGSVSSSPIKLIVPTLVPPLIIFGIFFLVFRYSIKKSYQKNQRASETITYNFTDTHLGISGESFNSEMTWNKIYKVTQTKSWLLIWQNSQMANAIPLSLVSAEQLAALKVILTKNNTKNNLH